MAQRAFDQPGYVVAVENDLDRLTGMGLTVVARDLAADGVKVRHDPAALADITLLLGGEAHLRRALKTKTA